MKPILFTDNAGANTVPTVIVVPEGAITDASTVDLAASAPTPGAGNFGYLNIPQNPQTVDYTTVLADAGKHIYHALGAGAGDEYTIAANASVPYEIGTAITFVNMAADDITVIIASDVLNYADVGPVTTITIPQYNEVTALKILAAAWLASGTAGCSTS